MLTKIVLDQVQVRTVDGYLAGLIGRLCITTTAANGLTAVEVRRWLFFNDGISTRPQSVECVVAIDVGCCRPLGSILGDKRHQDALEARFTCILNAILIITSVNSPRQAA